MRKLSFLFVLFISTVLSAEDPVSLYGVHQVDAKTIYTVGNNSTVYVSEDGGRNFRKIPVPVNAVFQHCFFIDKNEGWVVGGQERYLAAGSIGVVLHTTDGGKHWEVSYPGTVGWLFDVHFQNWKIL